MARKKKGLIKTVWGACRGLVAGLGEKPRAKPPRRKNVERIYSKGAAAYSPEQQRKLEELCGKLFGQQDLVATGKLQLLGLGKVKRRLGKTWPGLQKVVHDTAQEAISKYMVPPDIFIRYKDDTYVIIFAKADLAEAQVKAALIAEEIRRRLFEHGEEALRDIGIAESAAVAGTETETLRAAAGLPGIAELIFQNAEKRKESPPPPPPKKPVEIPQAIEINPYADRKQEQKQAGGKPSRLDFSYEPLWDVRRGLLTTYVCVARAGRTQRNPVDAHEMAFIGVPPSRKARLDIEVLQRAGRELAEMEGDGRKLFISCPVHYDTLSHGESYEKYMLECQAVPRGRKEYLIFLLLGLPGRVHEANIHKFTVPLRGHCRAIHAQVPLSPETDFAVLRECRFDAVGVRLKKTMAGEKQVLERLESFARRADKFLIRKTFVLDTASRGVALAAVRAGFDFLGGPAVSAAVDKPGGVRRFVQRDLFADPPGEHRHG